MKIVSVILARGGSKGIPNKNIIDINGKPLISYSIEAAQNVLSIDEVWVSTDSDKIAKIAIEYGANIIQRPIDISGDRSKSEDALTHFANIVKFDIMVFIQPTSPLLRSSDLELAIKKMNQKKLDSIFSVYREHWIPRWTLNNKPFEWDIANRPMRQDKSELFVENGAFYITTRNAFENSGLRYSGTIGTYEMSMERSFQIDTIEDVKLIKKLI
jgi:N-acylneuraminate cytidylyltransferase